MTERVCVVHIGTHKTGTTLLQRVIQWNADALAAAGIWFPKSAWYGVVPGHHPAAWELLDYGVSTETANLFSELCENNEPHALISSEEFSLLFDRPVALRSFVNLIRDAGYTVKILVYLRAQPAFAESYFAERIKHSSVTVFSDYLEEIFRRGAIGIPGRRVTFRMSELLAPFKYVVGRENILIRPYPAGPAPLSLVDDFFHAVGLLIPELSIDSSLLIIHKERLNERLTFGHLLGTAFINVFPEIGLPNDPAEFIERYAPSLPRAVFDSPFSLLVRTDYLRFLSVFSHDNERVLAEYGATAPFLHEKHIPTRNDPMWATASFQRDLIDLCLRAWLSERKQTIEK